jgi:hypothetical protein
LFAAESLPERGSFLLDECHAGTVFIGIVHANGLPALGSKVNKKPIQKPGTGDEFDPTVYEHGVHLLMLGWRSIGACVRL